MTRRLVLGFVALVLLLVAVLGFVRNVNLLANLRAHDAGHATSQARLLLGLVQSADAAGSPIDSAALADAVDDSERFEVRRGGVLDAVATGPEFEGGEGRYRPVVASASSGDLTVRVVESAAGWRAVLAVDSAPLTATLLLAVLGAAAAGWLMARWFARPFTRLAAAAAMLGRGRFDLDLPRSRVPEARAVAAALEASAAALRDRMGREQQFSVHASHVLRTPLTSLRLSLDELAHSRLDADATDATRRCQASVDELDTVVADLVGMTRRGALMSGAEVPLRELAASLAQQWADGLLGLGRGFSAAVEGDLDLTLTPGPVEFVLDVLLEQARDEARADGAGAGAVRLVLVGAASSVVRLEVSGVRPPPPEGAGPQDPTDRLEQARSLVRSLGGRMEGRPGGDGVSVLLPPR
ncbi:histidine kinase dimerization/phospho-acceptor domain-containing protein [Nocardioides sp. AX2bis]|uniref:histidine kinase dimerization/phospho-acceptor domain-containing protein n=1 Tax=Nocardioides sp. AX2bis TaxID=2653157 RepID=UPI0012F2A0B6|nr:histidine kinase dimerization/phospho-acceptor domain-containing protein [Nocardioides sp. AX2bis]VXB93172.1 Signal transduction histidine kinase [Nocardioides sp. AX2bis]